MAASSATRTTGAARDAARTRSLRERKKDATAQAIIDAAWELFEENGYTSTSINDIAARANIAPRTFFRYFPSKEAVAYPEVDEMIGVIRETFFARPPDESPLASLLASFDATSSMTDRSARNQARLALIKRDNNAAIGEYVRKRLTDAVSAMVLERDAHRPDAELRAKLTSGIVGLIIDASREHWEQTGDSERMHDVGRRCFAVVTDLIELKND
jgi:AcrR family transcriptional regulator